jgi:type 2 lantibiotic biosynthesis protein LanM
VKVDVEVQNREFSAQFATADWIERLILRAATFDEVLSDEFEPMPGQKGDTDLAARRLAAWCRASASGDWSLFARRLERDGLSLTEVLTKFATVRRRPGLAAPAWVTDALWIVPALENATTETSTTTSDSTTPYPFEHLLIGLVDKAATFLWSSIDERTRTGLADSACRDLTQALLKELSELCAPSLYQTFSRYRKQPMPDALSGNASRYLAFIAEMRAGGVRRLFQDKPVLLRLVATVTRQWLETSRELVIRLDQDRELLESRLLLGPAGRVTTVEGDLSDPHNGGRSVNVLTFEAGARIVYKPKDLRLDVAWHSLISRLNKIGPPIALRALEAVARDGYGWTEYVAHTGCADQACFGQFFRRAGAWLALFHCFAATDMHHENIIAVADQPVPIDLEMILQSSVDQHKTGDPETQAFEAVLEQLGNSVLMVGLLPTYTRSAENEVLASGGLISEWSARERHVLWKDANSDHMRPSKAQDSYNGVTPNLPHVAGHYAEFGCHLDEFITGFEDYSNFLLEVIVAEEGPSLLDGFDDVLIRKIVHITRFYYELLQRMTNRKNMDDGVLWSVQADFVARLADWDEDEDPLWPLQRAQRSALVTLNVPYFVSLGDENEIRDLAGALALPPGVPGITRARARIQSLDREAVAWQSEIIRESTAYASRSDSIDAATHAWQWNLVTDPRGPSDVIDEAGRIADELADVSIRRPSAAAWVGLDWLGDSDVSQLVLLGPEFYNGLSGIGVFLAAHAAVTGHEPSAALALAGVAHLRKSIRGPKAARFARSLGLGALTGLGSLVYALTVMSKYVGDDGLLDDADRAAELVTDDLIAADTLLDVAGGSAGAILGLLRLYRDTASEDALRRAARCGDHLLGRSRTGPEGARTWRVPGLSRRPLTGISHGAAGFAYALASLAAATEREDFAAAAAESLTFENSTYDPERMNWPDLRGDGEPRWSCQWCHGAAGIGLARIGMIKHGPSGAGGMDSDVIATDVERAVGGVERAWPGHLDTLCCGTLGGIELLREASAMLGRDDLRTLATQRLTTVMAASTLRGDYRWNSSNRRFNVGLFRGLAGTGYTLLREIDASLPNVLIFQ